MSAAGGKAEEDAAAGDTDAPMAEAAAAPPRDFRANIVENTEWVREADERIDRELAEMPAVQFPHACALRIPFPTPELAEIARRSLAADGELKPDVVCCFLLLSFSSVPNLPAGLFPGEKKKVRRSLRAENEFLLAEFQASEARLLRTSVKVRYPPPPPSLFLSACPFMFASARMSES
jgi:Transcription factor Pcc1